MTEETPEVGAAQPQPITDETTNLDLDKRGAARTEKKVGKHITFKKKRFDLPKELPYDLVSLLGEMEASMGFGFSGPLDETLELLLGKEQLAKFKKLKPSVEDVGDMVRGVLVMYGLAPGESPASSTS